MLTQFIARGILLSVLELLLLLAFGATSIGHDKPIQETIIKMVEFHFIAILILAVMWATQYAN